MKDPHHLFSTFTLPKRYDSLPLLTRLWLHSRQVTTGADPEFRKAGLPRPLTVANLKLSADILRIVIPRIWASTRRDHLVRLVIHLLYLIIEGVSPVAR